MLISHSRQSNARSSFHFGSISPKLAPATNMLTLASMAWAKPLNLDVRRHNVSRSHRTVL